MLTPATADTSVAEKPPFDPTAILSKLEGLIKSNQKPAEQGGGGKSWISTLIIIVVALAGVAIWSWISLRKNRELAALRHEKEKARIEADQAEMHAELAEHDQVLKERQRELEAARENIRIIEADLAASEARYEADRRAIDRIRSWDDVPDTR